MILISCVDETLHILTHEELKKRPFLLGHLLRVSDENKLWMNHKSAALFEGMEAGHVNVDDNFLNEASSLESCFVEDTDVTAYMRWVDHIILFRVSETLPSVCNLRIPLDGWIQESHVSFNDAPDLTAEFYIRDERLCNQSTFQASLYLNKGE